MLVMLLIFPKELLPWFSSAFPASRLRGPSSWAARLPPQRAAGLWRSTLAQLLWLAAATFGQHWCYQLAFVRRSRLERMAGLEDGRITRQAGTWWNRWNPPVVFNPPSHTMKHSCSLGKPVRSWINATGSNMGQKHVTAVLGIQGRALQMPAAFCPRWDELKPWCSWRGT